MEDLSDYIENVKDRYFSLQGINLIILKDAKFRFYSILRLKPNKLTVWKAFKASSTC